MTESAKTESSLLTQRLQRRLVDLPGVIDTQNPHRHYGAIQTTSDRLIQRLVLPETIASRYQIASLQPTAIAQRSNYQRVELRGGESSSLTWRVQRLPTSETDTQFINQVKVVASPSDIGQVSSSVSPVIQRQELQEEVARFIEKPSIPADSSSDLPPGKFRISRQPSLTGDNFSAASSSSYSSDRFSGDSSSLYSSQPGVATTVTAPSTNTNLLLSPSFGQAASQPSGSVIQTQLDSTAHPHTQEAPTVTTIQRDLVMRSPESNSATSAVNHTENITYQNQILSNNTENISSQNITNTATTVVSPPSTLVYATSSPLKVQRQPSGDLGSRGATLRLISPNDQRSVNEEQGQMSEAFVSTSPMPSISDSLPLVVNPASNSGLIQRAIVEPASGETITPASTPMTTAAANSPTENSVDVAELAEQVSRIILRRMTVERERRGIGR